MSPRRLIPAALLACGIACAARRLVTYEVDNTSMVPTLRPGDWVVGWSRPTSVRTGDIVVIEHPGRRGFDLVKRVTAVAGDVPHAVSAPIPTGFVWVEGDAPHEGSVDSRELGPIAVSQIRARVVARYHPNIGLMSRRAG